MNPIYNYCFGQLWSALSVLYAQGLFKTSVCNTNFIDRLSFAIFKQLQRSFPANVNFAVKSAYATFFRTAWTLRWASKNEKKYKATYFKTMSTQKESRVKGYITASPFLQGCDRDERILQPI